MERRLAAILCADMFGYSRLVEANEQGVLDRQKAHRRELIDPEIERNRGRIVKTTGDGLLAEFDTANDAVRCAIDIQAAMRQREPASLKDQRIQYRIGINVGDLVFDDGDVFGDAVNIASRIESLGEPGAASASPTWCIRSFGTGCTSRFAIWVCSGSKTSPVPFGFGSGRPMPTMRMPAKWRRHPCRRACSFAVPQTVLCWPMPRSARARRC